MVQVPGILSVSQHLPVRHHHGGGESGDTVLLRRRFESGVGVLLVHDVGGAPKGRLDLTELGD